MECLFGGQLVRVDLPRSNPFGDARDEPGEAPQRARHAEAIELKRTSSQADPWNRRGRPPPPLSRLVGGRHGSVHVAAVLWRGHAQAPWFDVGGDVAQPTGACPAETPLGLLDERALVALDGRRAPTVVRAT